MSVIRPVILSGGSGTRLWPLSTPRRPKQFAELIPGRPNLFEATLARLHGMPGVAAPVVVTGSDHLGLVLESAAHAGVDLGPVIVEPSGRNTAPAAAAAALAVDPAEILVLLPADHLVEGEARYRQHVAAAVGLAASGHIVVFGVAATRPETGYGYIEMGAQEGVARRVARFKEKPGLEEAIDMSSDGNHLWNAGMFITAADTMLEEMMRTAPGLVEGVRSAMPGPGEGVMSLRASFNEVESISFDHAVMERTDRALVISIDVGWDDIGSYRALMGHLPKDGAGNAVSGPVVLDRVVGSFVLATSRTVAVSGVESMVVVETPEGTLVVPLDQAQTVRGLAGRAGRG